MHELANPDGHKDILGSVKLPLTPGLREALESVDEQKPEPRKTVFGIVLSEKNEEYDTQLPKLCAQGFLEQAHASNANLLSLYETFIDVPLRTGLLTLKQLSGAITRCAQRNFEGVEVFWGWETFERDLLNDFLNAYSHDVSKLVKTCAVDPDTLDILLK